MNRAHVSFRRMADGKYSYWVIVDAIGYKEGADIANVSAALDAAKADLVTGMAIGEVVEAIEMMVTVRKP